MATSEPTKAVAAPGSPAHRRITHIQALRAVAILLVIFRHILVFQSGVKGATGQWRDVFMVGDAGVDVFFVISGFVMVEATRAMFRRRHAVYDFFSRRVTRIYPVYWAYLSVLVVVYSVNPSVFNRIALGGRIDIGSSYLLLPAKQSPLLGQAWSLIHEMYFYTVFALLLLAPRRWLPVGLAAWGGAIVAAHIGASHHLLTVPPLAIMTHPLTFEFIAGCVIALVFERIRPHRGGWIAFGAGALMLGVIGIVNGAHLHQAVWEIPNDRILLFGIPGALMVYGAVVAELRSGPSMPSIMTTVGNASYSTYLGHVMVIGGLMKIWPGDPPLQALAPAIVLAAIMIACSLIAGELSYRFMERPMMRATTKFLNRRRGAAVV